MSIDNQPSKTKRLARLPDSYTAVRPVILPKNEPDVPPLQGPFIRICPGMKEAFSLEYKWLEHVRDELNREISQISCKSHGHRSTQTNYFLIEKISRVEDRCYLYFKKKQLQRL